MLISSFFKHKKLPSLYFIGTRV